MTAEQPPQERSASRRESPPGGWERRHDPFEPSNQLARTHGAYSEQAIAERADHVHAALLEHAPWCDEPQYAPSVRRYLEATAREQLAHEALMSGAAKLSPRLLEAATSASRLAWLMADQLGLTPAGHAKLRALTAATVSAEVGLSDLLARGSAGWQQRDRDGSIEAVAPAERPLSEDEEGPQ